MTEDSKEHIGFEQFLMMSHDAAMSDVPIKASCGRANKLFATAFHSYMQDEIERETDPAIVLSATCNALASLVFSSIQALASEADDKATVELMEIILKAIREKVQYDLKNCKQID